jgi:ABC-2 type transport system ATP-binding protein
MGQLSSIRHIEWRRWNKSKKILDGSVKDIKKQYQNQSFFIDFTATGLLVDHANPIYDLVALHAQDDIVQMEIRINADYTLNDVLNYLIPHVQIHQVKEIVPTIHDIFIEKVTHTYEQN